MEFLMRQNQELQKQLVQSMMGTSQLEPAQYADTSGFLKILLECAANNAKRKKNAYRFTDTMKELALVLFSMGNLQIYEFLSANLPFPSISTVRKYIYSNEVIVEGEFRIKEFKLFLTERNYPLSVHCCEDATVVVKQLQYHAPSNQIVGNVLPLDQNGLPIPNSFPATSALVISEYFKKEQSQYLYCIMAQPIVNKSAPYCIAMFGTNNRFTSAQVHTRWMWTIQALQEAGIVVVSFSADGDSRLLKTMRYNTILPRPNAKWSWFQAELKPPFICIQDHIHLGIKLKTRVLKPSIVLPLGPLKIVSRGHLVELITQTQTRDQHLLCLSDINPKDKMNFRAFQKMSDPKVSSLLIKEVKDSEGTSAYLEMMCQIVESYTRVDLSPLERVERIWEWVFFLRMWKSWVLNTEGYTITNNFISFNSYYCVELNAHALIQCIIWFRDREEHASFLPWLLSSQPCEGTFRKLRSPKVTGSGVTCFTVQEARNFFRRLDLSMAAQKSLESIVKFPRHHKQMKPSDAAPHIPLCLPEDYEIEESIKVAFGKAVNRAMALKIIKTRPKCIIPASLAAVSKSDMDLIDEDEDEDCDLENIINFENEDDNESESELLVPDNDQNDIDEDLFVASAGPIHLKTYDVCNLTETSPFVRVVDKHGIISIIKKSTLCWLLKSTESKISSDRLLRVQEDGSATNKSSSSTQLTCPSREDFVSVGEWCAFKFEDRSIGVGRILAFSYLTGTSLKHQEYSKLDAPTTPPPKNARGLGCLCTWFTIQKNQLVATQMDLHGYYDINNYVCSIPRPKLEGKKLLMVCTLSQIKRFCK